MFLSKLVVRENLLNERSSLVLNQILMKSQMRHFDVRDNQIVLRFLDNLLVTAGYKFNLEFFGIEGNQRSYQSKNAVCSCISIKTYSGGGEKTAVESQFAFTKVSPLQIQNRNQRVTESVDRQVFLTAKINIRKCRVHQKIERFRETHIVKHNLPQLSDNQDVSS